MNYNNELLKEIIAKNQEIEQLIKKYNKSVKYKELEHCLTTPYIRKKQKQKIQQATNSLLKYTAIIFSAIFIISSLMAIFLNK